MLMGNSISLYLLNSTSYFVRRIIFLLQEPNLEKPIQYDHYFLSFFYCLEHTFFKIVVKEIKKLPIHEACRYIQFYTSSSKSSHTCFNNNQHHIIYTFHPARQIFKNSGLQNLTFQLASNPTPPKCPPLSSCVSISPQSLLIPWPTCSTIGSQSADGYQILKCIHLHSSNILLLTLEYFGTLPTAQESAGLEKDERS